MKKNLCFARTEKRKSCYCESDQCLCLRYIDTQTYNSILPKILYGRPRECHNKIMQPILSTIFDISNVKPFSVAVPGACTALFISDPVATQNTGFLVTSSSKLRKKQTKKKTTFDLCFTVRQDFFHLFINRVG